MSIDADALDALDRGGYLVLEALTRGTPVAHNPGTHAHPLAFVCIDGKTYWVKGTAQQGLVAELIAGRLAAKVGAGPVARIIRVSSEVHEASGATPEMINLVVGSAHQDGTVNARDLQPFMQSGVFKPGLVDAVTRARTIAFQSWIGAGDSQVLLSLTAGTVFSIDHGDCFGSTATLTDPTIIATDIPGVAPTVGKDPQSVDLALSRMEAVSDRDLIEAVARIPSGDPWRSPVGRRVEIAGWLAHRRDRLRAVMTAWLQT